MPGATIGLAAYCYGTVAALLVLRLRADGIAVDHFALAVFAAAFLVVRFAGSPLVDRYGGRTAAASTVTFEIVALAGLAVARGPVSALVFTALEAAFFVAAGFATACVVVCAVFLRPRRAVSAR